MHKKVNLEIILGSTREGRMSDKIANALKKIAAKRTDIITEIIDLKDYNLPFFNDGTAPATREVITDPIIKKWSDKINSSDAFIIIVPEYNAGYPGVLKNALDTIYKEWNNKPVGFIGYAGGKSGGKSAIAQLRQVVTALEMLPVDSEITIPNSWKALDEKGGFIDKNIENDFNKIIDQIVSAKKTLEEK